jgi:hypothetical protein
MIDLSKYENIFMSKINEHGDKQKLHNAGIVKINKEDISIAYVGVSHGEGKNEFNDWIVKTYHYDISFRMKCGLDISIPVMQIESGDADFENKQDSIKLALKQELNELLGDTK